MRAHGPVAPTPEEIVLPGMHGSGRCIRGKLRPAGATPISLSPPQLILARIETAAVTSRVKEVKAVHELIITSPGVRHPRRRLR